MKPRPTPEEFKELRRKRDESLETAMRAMAVKMGQDPSKLTFHVSGMTGCYCACPEGPCEHQWDGSEVNSETEGWSSVTCSKCGMLAISHSLRCGP